jgi:transposase
MSYDINGLVKINLAAKWLEITPKTIYNWIEDGLLEMPEKGKVRRSEVERVHRQQILSRSIAARMKALGIGRDNRGRFIDLRKDLPKDPI